MKKLNVVLAFAFFVLLASSAEAQEEITDEDLKAYAIIEKSKQLIISGISPMVNDLIKKQEGLDGKRFNELRKTKGDEAKLASIDAKDFEVKFLTMVNEEIDKRTEAAKEVVGTLVKYGLGADKYKLIKKSIKDDQEVKGRFDSILNAI
ncbi:MAG: hypothetical protein AAF519_02595 [Bacteroidota bacterium]